MRSLPLSLAKARIRNSRTFNATCTAAIALAFLTLFSLQGISNSRSMKIVDYSLASIPRGENSLTVASTRLIRNSNDRQKITSFLNKSSKGVIPANFKSEVLFHELSDAHGTGFYLGSVDRLKNEATLTSGRFPDSCTATQCEVIQIGGVETIPQTDAFKLVIVGRGSLKDKNFFSGTFALDQKIPLLLSDGIDALLNLNSFSALQGSNGWVADLDTKRIALDGADNAVNSIIAMENRAALDFEYLSFTWPQDDLGDANTEAKSLRAKINTVGHSVVALLSVFLVLLTLRRKRNHQLFRSSLSRIGTPESVLIQEIFIEYATPLAFGAFLAIALSPVLLNLLNAVNVETNFSQLSTQWTSYPFLVLALIFIQLTVALVGDRSWRKRVWISFFLALIFTSLFLYLGHQASLSEWKPSLVGASLAICLSGVTLKWTIAIWRRKDKSTFILLRENLGVWQAGAAILSFVIFFASMFLSFQTGVNKNLNAAIQEQVPLDISISTGSTLVNPLDIGGVTDYESITKGSRAFPILRVGSSINGKNSVADSIEILGVPAGSASKLLKVKTPLLEKVFPQHIAPEPGIPMGEANLISIRLGNIPRQIDLVGWFRTSYGKHTSAVFSGHDSRRTLRLDSNFGRGSTLVALELRETSDYLSRRLHAEGEGRFQVPALVGVGEIKQFKLDNELISLSGRGWKVSPFKYSFDGNSLFLRPTWNVPTPVVITDRETALLANDGILTISGLKNQSFRVRVASSQSTFPTAGDRFIIMNLESLQAEIATTDPGALDPIEIWISTPNSKVFEERFAQSKYKVLSVKSQRAIAIFLRSNPSNTGLHSAYVAALGFASILSGILLFSTLPLVRREKSDLVFHLESIGISRDILRRSLSRSFRHMTLIACFVGVVIGSIGARIFFPTPLSNGSLFLLAGVIFILGKIGSWIYLKNALTESTLVMNVMANYEH